MTVAWGLGIVAWILSTAGQTPGQNFDPHKYEWAATLDRTAAVRFDGVLWEFAANPGGEGLLVRMHHPGRMQEILLSFDGALGQVIAVDASTREYEGQLFIAVGVAGVQPNSDHIEYRLLQGRRREDVDGEAGWIYTLPLMTLPLNRPHELMSVSALGGDSIMMTVQTLERVVGSENRIETHTFVSHCPIPGSAGPRIFRTAHYVARTEQRVIEKAADAFVP